MRTSKFKDSSNTDLNAGIGFIGSFFFLTCFPFKIACTELDFGGELVPMGALISVVSCDFSASDSEELSLEDEDSSLILPKADDLTTTLGE
jgi:hypothetical protein